MEEDVEEFQKEDRTAKFLSKVSVVHLVIIGILFLGLVVVSRSKTDPIYNYIIFGILVAIIALLYFKPSKGKNIIPEWLAKKKALAALERKRREGSEIAFDSKVLVMPQCQLTWKDDMITGDSVPTGWDIGFKELIHGSKYSKEGVITLNPYTGEVTGICWMPFGYSGTEKATRVKIVPVGVLGTVQGGVNPKDFKNPAP